MNSHRWTRQLHDAMLPEARENDMDVYHLVDIKYKAIILPGPTVNGTFTQQIRFFDDQLHTMFVLRYGDKV